MSDQKYCILKQDKNPITITFKIDEDMQSGSDFKLFDPKTKTVIENFKISSSYEKPGVYKFTTKVDRLNGLKLNYMLVICSKNPNNFRGKVQLDILQAGLPVKLTAPLSYTLQNVPPCNFGNSEKIKGSLFFVVNKDLTMNPFTGRPQNQ
ncbi:hypothetical protein OAQ99_02390 [Candidatus Kapabacteria bacterium]|nr:hypothetical protein [Candidatus Kapabacteria bacterium]